MFAAASAQPSGEEPAWTGFAMEQIMKTLSFVNSSLVQAPREEKEKLAHKLDDTLYCAKVQCAHFNLKMGLITNHDESCSWMQCYRRHCYGNMFWHYYFCPVRAEVPNLQWPFQQCVLYKAERQALPHSLCRKVPPGQHWEGKKRGGWIHSMDATFVALQNSSFSVKINFGGI